MTGYMYEAGLGVDTNYEEAFKYYLKGASLKDYKSCDRLGYFYEKGLGTEKNLEESIKWYNLSKEYENILE